MQVSHYILTLVFFLGLSLLNLLIPFDLNTLLVSFLVVYLLHKENNDDKGQGIS